MKLRNPRMIAWEAVRKFEKTHRDPDEILNAIIDSSIDDRDKSLAWEITNGTIRYLKKLDFIAQTYIKAPLSSQKPKVLAALRIGLYQLVEMTGIPQFAAVDQTVKLIVDEGMKRDAGFVNAILRSYLREPDKVKYPNPESDPIPYLSIFYSYPEWLVKRWNSRFGYIETMQMLIANNSRPKTFFRVLRNKSRQEILDSFGADESTIEAGKYFPEYIAAEYGQEIITSDFFKNGELIVQDESQGLPIHLLDPPTDSFVLDLCSGPGGKTIALADTVGPKGKVVSVEKDPGRLNQIRESAMRVGLENIEFVQSDMMDFAPDIKFKYILLDVPCSGFGTLSHNADLRWTKTEKDIKALAGIQARMLAKASKFLAEGGYLVYSTCTTEPEEIEDVVSGFLKSDSSLRLKSGGNAFAGQFETGPGFYRTWPHKHGIGGGGFVLLRKVDENKTE